MLHLNVRRVSTGARSILHVDPNDTVADVMQMAMFDVGELDLTTASVSLEQEGPRHYLRMDLPFAVQGFTDGQTVDLAVHEEDMQKVAEIAARFRSAQSDPEAQRLARLDRVRKETFDAYPEMFLMPHMLHLNVVMNGRPVHCLVDTGAHSSTISVDVAKRCDLMPWVDTRVKGRAVGVGTAEIIGIIYNTNVSINGHVYPISLTVLNQRSVGAVDFLFGLDMLRRHGCIIDVKRYELRFDDGNVVPFLSDRESQAIEGGGP